MILYIVLMHVGPHPESSFSRAELCDRAGIADGVASFWIKQQIIRPIGERAGKGRHLRFDRYEVSFAAILAVLHGYGINIERLGSLASMLHRARDICSATGLDKREVVLAANFKRLASTFRAGGLVEVTKYYPDRARSDQLEWVPAENEAEILDEVVSGWFSDEAIVAEVKNRILERARAIPEGLPVDFINLFQDVADDLDALMNSESAWLLWPDESAWSFLVSSDGLTGFPDFREPRTNAIFLSISEILRQTWGFSRRDRDIAYVVNQIENGDDQDTDSWRQRLEFLRAG